MENKNEFQPVPIPDKVRRTVDHFVRLKRKNSLDHVTFRKMLNTYEACAKGEQKGEWSQEEYQILLAKLREERIIEE